jgi:CheY-like chemotaxis protein
MDIMMPDMDGYQATAKIREGQAGSRRTPIIGLSARAMEGDRETALFAGLDDYLTKPLREDQLRAAFDRWIDASARA